MSFINKMNIGKRLYVLIGGIVLIAFLVFGLYIYSFVADTMEENYTESINNYLENYYSMIEMEIKSKQQAAGIALHLADTYLNSLGAISVVPGEMVSVGEFSLTKWIQGGKQVQLSNEVADKYTEMGIEMSSIFQKTDKGFVRIVTSVKNDDGSRALGSIIPIDSPVGKTVACGETYIGRSYVLGTWLIAAYKPFYINGEVAGVVAVAQPEIDYASLSANFATKKYFGSGYPYIVDGNGVLTAHPNAVGVSLAEYAFFSEIVAKKNGSVVYDWKGREKTQYYKYLQDIDSYITVGWYTEDYDATFVTMRLVIGIAVFIALAVVISVLYVLVKRIVASIQRAVVAAEQLASGNMNVDLETDATDETGLLLNSMATMANTMKGLVSEFTAVAIDSANGVLGRRAKANDFEGEYHNMASGFNNALDAVINPLMMTAEYVDRISKGDMPPMITEEYKGDFNEIKNNLNLCIDSITLLIQDANMLSVGAIAGQLDVRADATRHQGDFRKIIEGFNLTLDSIIGPLNITAEYFDRISKGDMPPMITDNLKGDFNEIKNNVNLCIAAISLLITDANMLADGAIEGHLDVRAKADKHSGDFRKIIEGVNDTLDAVISPLVMTAEYVDRISKGDMPPVITAEYRGDFNEIKNNLNLCIESISLLIQDANMMANAAEGGQLDQRADITRHSGDYASIIKGFNNTMDNVVKPLRLGADYIEKIGHGEIPKKIADNYKGDYAAFIASINSCIDGLGALTAGNDILQKMAMNDVTEMVEGDFKGIFGEIKDAINSVNDRIRHVQNICVNISAGNLSELSELERRGKRCANDQLSTALIGMMQNIQALVLEAGVLEQAVVVGDLKTRGSTEKFQGEFRNVITGVNNIVNAVVAPIDEAGAILSKMATGDLTIRMKGAYKGDFEKLKKDINSLGASLHEMVLQVNDTVDTTANSATEISTTAEILAAASQEMNSQADDVASAVEEMARTVTENADGATKTADLARQSAEIAVEGGSVVQETVQKMSDIAKVVEETARNIEKLGASSQAIGEIVRVIDDIADQTNLLALNASIEAARAGEQGRGFAVVADEVRKLAEKTVEATKEIAGQIKSIQKDATDAVLVMNQGTKEVQAGIELADRAGKSLDNILASSNEVTTMIADIAAASEEQAATTEEISKNVLGISQATAESTRQVEDVAGTAEELTQLTTRLSQLMGQFKVSRDAHIDANSDYFLDGDGLKRLS